MRQGEPDRLQKEIRLNGEIFLKFTDPAYPSIRRLKMAEHTGSKPPEALRIKPRAALTPGKMSEKVESSYTDLSSVMAEMNLAQDSGQDYKKDIRVLHNMLQALHEMHERLIARGQ